MIRFSAPGLLAAAGLAVSALAAGPALVAVPHPDPADFERGVGEALRSGREAFAAQREGAAGADLGAAYGRLGKLYLAHHLIGAAESALANAAGLAPEAFEWRYLLGYARQERGDLDQAARDYARALELDPGYQPARLRLGEVALAAGRPGEAREHFRSALKQEPRSAFVLAGLGRVALQEQDYEAAIRWLEQALAVEPEASGLYYPLAMAYRHKGDRERARALMSRRGKRNPAIPDPVLTSVGTLTQSVQAYLERGYAAMRENRPSRAIEDFEQAVALAPDDLSARVSLAQALAITGRTEEAMVQVDAALELDGSFAPAHYRKGALLELAGDLEAAAAQYRTAVELNPDYTQARLLLAYALMARDEFAAAAEQFTELSERQPGSVVFRYRLGLARLAMGDCEAAQTPLEEARQLDPRAGEILAALARTYATCASTGERKRREALDTARRLYEARPQPEHATTLAMALAANGRFDEAAALQSQVLAAARPASAPDRLAALEEDLANYRAGEPADRAWPAQAPVFDPPRLDPAAVAELD